VTAYDPAGNAIARTTASMAAAGERIAFDYEFNRLAGIAYPQFPGNDVTYTYGAAGDADAKAKNQLGRIARVTHQAGSTAREYDKLGNVAAETLTFTAGQGPDEVYTTQFRFDTYGRLLKLTYPDGEVLRHAYDSGGNLARIEGTKQGQAFAYLQALEYDRFEQRTRIVYGNGVASTYTYRPDNRRLERLQSQPATGEAFQQLAYAYDRVGNVTRLANETGFGPQSSFGGPVVQHFAYDGLYRLTCAAGEFQPSGREADAYTLRMAYDAIHNITGKVQDHVTVRGGRAEPACEGQEPRLSLTGDPRTQRGTAYAWNYDYNTQVRGAAKPHAPSRIGERTFAYDDNGNQTGWASTTSGQRRANTWDEENRLQEVVGPSGTTSFAYDDAGQRVLKRGEMGETVYVNQFYVVRNGAIATKHVFAGITRVASKLMPGESGG
jgi:YD repeat-containing protein